MNFIKKTWIALLFIPTWRLSLLIFGISFLLRIGLVLALHTYRDLSRYELERTAISLATTGVYGNPYAVPTGPTAHVSPGYTLILAAIFRLFGAGISGEIVKQGFACFITSLQYSLIPAAAEALSVGRRAAIIAAAVCVFIPAKPLVQMDGDWETPYTALFLLLVCVSAARWWSSHHFQARQAIKRGVLWGLAILFASVLLPIFFSYLAAGAWFQRRNFSRYLQMTAIEVLVAFCCLTPWIVRNYFALGQPIVTRSNLGLELRVSNNDEASPDQRENYLRGVYARYHPLQNRDEALRVRALGEVAYNQEAQRKASNWIANHPVKYFQLTTGRAWKFWFYNDPTSRFKTVFLAVTGFLGLLGAARLIQINQSAGTAVGLILLLYPAPSYLIHVGLRQRYPIDWLLTLLSVFVCFEFINRFMPPASAAHESARITKRQ